MIDEAMNEGIALEEIYDIAMIPNSPTSYVPGVHYHFVEPSEYDLYVEQDDFDSFYISKGYSNFIVSDDSISAYWFQDSNIHLSYEMYGYLTGTPLFFMDDSWNCNSSN